MSNGCGHWHLDSKSVQNASATRNVIDPLRSLSQRRAKHVKHARPLRKQPTHAKLTPHCPRASYYTGIRLTTMSHQQQHKACMAGAVYTFTHPYMYTYIYICIHVYLYVYMYIYIYMCIYMYVYVYIYI